MKRKTNKSQAVVEYVVIFALVLAGLISAAFFKDIEKPFKDHFEECVGEITNGGAKSTAAAQTSDGMVRGPDGNEIDTNVSLDDYLSEQILLSSQGN